jgi:hypothetical protein
MIIAPATGTPLQNAPIRIDDLLVGVDLAGLRWSYQGLSGWWDPAPLRDRMVDRPASDGSFDAPPLRSSRIITLTGLVRAQTRGAAAVAADRISALMGSDLGTFAVLDPDLGSREVQCRLTGTPQVDASAIGVGLVRWQLMFRSPDYRKYGQSVTATTGLRTLGTGLVYPLVYPLSYGTPGTGGSVQFTNTGTAPTEPVFTVSGALSAGFQLTWVETGQHLTYSFPVGSDVVIDCGAGTASTQGQDRTVYLTSRDWFSVPAGATATFQIAALGGETGTSAPTVTFTASTAPAYS